MYLKAIFPFMLNKTYKVIEMKPFLIVSIILAVATAHRVIVEDSQDEIPVKQVLDKVEDTLKDIEKSDPSFAILKPIRNLVEKLKGIFTKKTYGEEEVTTRLVASVLKTSEDKKSLGAIKKELDDVIKMITKIESKPANDDFFKKIKGIVEKFSTSVKINLGR